jgi:26S proteasome regulatory subunit N11
MVELAAKYNKMVQEEDKISAEKLQIQNVGKIDPKKHLEDGVTHLMSDNILQALGTMLDTIVF